MSISRRHFLSGMVVAGTIAAKNRLQANGDNISSISAPKNLFIQREDGVILPPALREGARVGIVAPASGVSHGEISDGVHALESFGCKVEVSKFISKNFGYLSCKDEERAAEFMHFIERKDIDAILCARGGYGVMRILPMLDYNVIRQNPKIIIGFSDITALLNAIYLQSKVVTFHGPVASSTFDSFTREYFYKTLFTTSAVGQIAESQEFDSIEFSEQRLTTLGKGGTARGRLVGGNLSLVTSTLGTPYEIQTKGNILFLEEVSEEPYKIDRMLTQLWLAGKLQEASAIALGRFRKCEKIANPSFSVSFSLEEVLRSRIASLGVPAVYGLPIGHIRSKMTVPIGTMSELDADEGRLTLLEPSVTI